jgi:hypothetical protein
MTRTARPRPLPSYPIYLDASGRLTFSETLYRREIGRVICPDGSRLWVDSGLYAEVLLVVPSDALETRPVQALAGRGGGGAVLEVRAAEARLTADQAFAAGGSGRGEWGWTPRPEREGSGT